MRSQRSRHCDKVRGKVLYHRIKFEHYIETSSQQHVYTVCTVGGLILVLLIKYLFAVARLRVYGRRGAFVFTRVSILLAKRISSYLYYLTLLNFIHLLACLNRSYFLTSLREFQVLHRPVRFREVYPSLSEFIQAGRLWPIYIVATRRNGRWRICAARHGFMATGGTSGGTLRKHWASLRWSTSTSCSCIFIQCPSNIMFSMVVNNHACTRDITLFGHCTCNT